jgi:hypothetical protein
MKENCRATLTPNCFHLAAALPTLSYIGLQKKVKNRF